LDQAISKPCDVQTSSSRPQRWGRYGGRPAALSRDRSCRLRPVNPLWFLIAYTWADPNLAFHPHPASEPGCQSSSGASPSPVPAPTECPVQALNPVKAQVQGKTQSCTAGPK